MGASYDASRGDTIGSLQILPLLHWSPPPPPCKIALLNLVRGCFFLARFLSGAAMPTMINCPACDCRLKLPDQARAKKLKCPKCGHTFPVDAVEAPASPQE